MGCDVLEAGRSTREEQGWEGLGEERVEGAHPPCLVSSAARRLVMTWPEMDMSASSVVGNEGGGSRALGPAGSAAAAAAVAAAEAAVKRCGVGSRGRGEQEESRRVFLTRGQPRPSWSGPASGGGGGDVVGVGDEGDPDLRRGDGLGGLDPDHGELPEQVGVVGGVPGQGVACVGVLLEARCGALLPTALPREARQFPGQKGSGWRGEAREGE